MIVKTFQLKGFTAKLNFEADSRGNAGIVSQGYFSILCHRMDAVREWGELSQPTLLTFTSIAGVQQVLASREQTGTYHDPTLSSQKLFSTLLES